MLERKAVKSPESRIREEAAKGKHKPIKVAKSSYENFCHAHDQEKVVLSTEILYPLQTAVKSQFQKTKQLEQDNIFAVIHFTKEVRH